MITSLSVENFKSWRTTGAVRLAPITALFGSNSSGKTSLLQLLLMLKQTTESADRTQPLNLGDDRTPVELGTFPDILFGHDLEQELRWDVEWQLGKPLVIQNPDRKGAVLYQGHDLGFSSVVGRGGGANGAGGRPVVRRMSYRFAGVEFGMRLRTGGKSEYDLFPTGGGSGFKRTQGRVWQLPAPAKCYGFPDQVRAYFVNAAFLSDLELEFEKLFGRVFYLGPLREYPKRQYTWAGARPVDMGRRGERVVDALLAAREDGSIISPGHRKRRMTLEARVARWLQVLGLIDTFEIRPVAEGSNLYQVWVRRSTGAPEVLLTDVGFGVSQILPVIALCYYAEEGSTLILEQPEIHLHPRVQAGLADVFIDAIKNRGVQIILESHSEHLLKRLQRRIAEEALTPEQAALYFCTMEDGASSLRELELDIFGNILNWPDEFFGDDIGEIEAMTRARLARRTQETP